MKKTYRFDLTADQIAVIRSILTMDSAVSKFGRISYEGGSWEGDACWVELLKMFAASDTNDVKRANGTFYNIELNTFHRYYDKKHVDVDYWAENVAEAKKLFNL